MIAFERTAVKAVRKTDASQLLPGDALLTEVPVLFGQPPRPLQLGFAFPQVLLALGLKDQAREGWLLGGGGLLRGADAAQERQENAEPDRRTCP